jgi:hypothetical protein
MATQTGNIISGTIGDWVYSDNNGMQGIRAKPKKVSNPRTKSQQANRVTFGKTSQLSSYMKEALNIGLHWDSVRKQKRPYLLFRSYNSKCFTPDGEIDFPHVVVSRGTLKPVDITSAVIDGGVLTVSFNGRVYGGAAKDGFFLFAYCHDLTAGLLAPPVPRSSGIATLPLPEEWLSHPLHIYAFLRGYRLRTSNTLYIPLTE